MFGTSIRRAPVVTLLSPSPGSARKAQNLLKELVGLDPISFTAPTNDHLNGVFSSFVSGVSLQWESVVSKCPNSGSIVHIFSGGNNEKSGPLALIGLTDSRGSVEETVQHVRDAFAEKLEEQSTSIKLKNMLGGGIKPMSLLKTISTGGLPLLEFPSGQIFNENANSSSSARLKEIVIPYFDYAKFTDGSTFLSRAAEASLERPAVGLYRWTNSSTLVRPLPTAGEDHRLPPPSLIFSCRSYDDIKEKAHLGVKVAKIGYSGNRIGQLMMLHPDIEGIDVRYCSADKASSAFSEAQESLLAASLEELQSTNALLGDGEAGKDDHRVGQADCWVEVRANLKRPLGYFQRTGGVAPARPKTANVPDIPYE